MIINLTQHSSTPEQGVVDLQGQELEALRESLTFRDLPTPEELEARAEYIAELAIHNGLGGEDDDPFPEAAMIGGAPYLMAPLEQALLARGIAPLYAFSRRESVEEKQPDGTTRKTSVFRHVGFVPACDNGRGKIRANSLSQKSLPGAKAMAPRRKQQIAPHWVVWDALTETTVFEGTFAAVARWVLSDTVSNIKYKLRVLTPQGLRAPTAAEQRAIRQAMAEIAVRLAPRNDRYTPKI